LQIYHDGSNSYIDDTGTGDLYIRANNLRLQNADGSEGTVYTNNGGNVELYYAGSKKLETTNDGVAVTLQSYQKQMQMMQAKCLHSVWLLLRQARIVL